MAEPLISTLGETHVDAGRVSQSAENATVNMAGLLFHFKTRARAEDYGSENVDDK